MDRAIHRLRSGAQQLTRGKAPTGIRYPAAFRTTAVALARPRLATGVPFVRVARELGLPTKSLARWLQRRPAPRLRPVAVGPDPTPAASVVLVTPHGCRVEGLDRDGLVAVLRALG
jgi:transposase-like protein